MKRFLLSVFILIASHAALKAQSSNNSLQLEKSKKAVSGFSQKDTPPFLFKNIPTPTSSALDLPDDEILGYYDPDMISNGDILSWKMPDTTKDQSGNPERQVREYGTRFTTSLDQPVLDSIHISFGAFNIEPTTAKSLKIKIRPQMNANVDPNNPDVLSPFPDPTKTIGTTKSILSTDPNVTLTDPDATEITINNYTVDYSSTGGLKLLTGGVWQKNFCVMMNVGAAATQNWIVLFTDKVTDQTRGANAYDTTLDRAFSISYLLTDITNGWSTGPLAGRFVLTSTQETLFPNFIMVAFLHNQGSSGVNDKPLSGNALAQNFPNPFNPSTQIKYSVANEAKVSLKVYNALGVEVATLVDGMQASGEHEVNFQAETLPSGTYFYTLKAGTFSETKRMVLSK
jgi:hypothetical protein